MNDLEDSAIKFVQRWSRRKRAAEQRSPGRADSSPAEKEADTNSAAQSDADLPPFDLATLPPIESITATSDIRAFLGPGVPEELTRAALRRVWVIDPTIRDFIGIAENQWDFTRPDNGVPGFGALQLTPELRRMVANLIGDGTGQSDDRQADAEPVDKISEVSKQLPTAAKALAPSEDIGAERSPARTGFAISEDDHADPVRIIAEDSNDALMQKSISDAGEKSRSIYHKHGGAVPK
jgi:hypothetical protein